MLFSLIGCGPHEVVVMQPPQPPGPIGAYGTGAYLPNVGPYGAYYDAQGNLVYYTSPLHDAVTLLWLSNWGNSYSRGTSYNVYVRTHPSYHSYTQTYTQTSTAATQARQTYQNQQRAYQRQQDSTRSVGTSSGGRMTGGTSAPSRPSSYTGGTSSGGRMGSSSYSRPSSSGSSYRSSGSSSGGRMGGRR
jgi:hypothetical protein